LGTNKYRYTTSNAENQPTLPSEESITKLFAQPAPFDVSIPPALTCFKKKRKGVGMSRPCPSSLLLA